MKQVIVMEAVFSWAPRAIVALVAARPARAARRVGCWGSVGSVGGIKAQCPSRARIDSSAIEIWLSGIHARASLTCAHEICDSLITIDCSRDGGAAVRYVRASGRHRGFVR